MRVISTVPACLIAGSVAAGVSAQTEVEPVQMHELFRIGGIEAPPAEEFTNELLSLSVGPHDQLFVLDFATSRIEVFSAIDGRHIRTISRQGRGPGEISEATALGWDEGSMLWDSEPFQGRFSQFDSAGNFIKTIPRNSRGTSSRTGKLQFDTRGRLVEVGAGKGPTFLAFSPESGEVLESWKTIPRVPPLPGMPPIMRMLPEAALEAYYALDPRSIWDWTPDGTVWAARTDQYRILEIAPDGDTVKVVEGPSEREMTSAEETAADLLRRASSSGSLELAAPQIQSIMRLEDGRLLVQIAGELNAPAREFDVFAPDGDYLGRVQSPLGISRLASPVTSGDRLYLVGVGEFDVPVVLALSLKLEPPLPPSPPRRVTTDLRLGPLRVPRPNRP